jgi:hypothetical protein
MKSFNVLPFSWADDLWRLLAGEIVDFSYDSTIFSLFFKIVLKVFGRMSNLTATSLFRLISHRNVVVDTDICDDWLKNKLPNLVKNYKACDIFNAEETGLFYKLMPNKTLQLKGEKCHLTRHSCFLIPSIFNWQMCYALETPWVLKFSNYQKLDFF